MSLYFIFATILPILILPILILRILYVAYITDLQTRTG